MAIAGLEQRLTQHFGVRNGAGIFASHFHRWLLWERAEEVESLRKIDFASTTINSPPSWSWMSYVGGITYLEPPKGKTKWNTKIKLTLTGEAQNSWLYKEEPLAMEAPILLLDPAAAAEIRGSLETVASPSERTRNDISLILDEPDRQHVPHRHFVIIGTFGDKGSISSRTYVLMVSPVPGTGTFVRIGAGWIPYRLVAAGKESDELSSVV